METIIEDMLILIKKKMAEQGDYGRDAYSQAIDETMDYFRQRGKMTDDENEVYIEKTLRGLYPSVKEEFLDEEA